MFEAKNFLASKTIWGAFVMMAPTVAGLLGFSLTEADAGHVVGAVETIIEAAGAILVVWGRVTASRPLRLW